MGKEVFGQSCQLGLDHPLLQMQISNESVELEELREMKADVERREKAQAAVLERQAKRLEELETLYKVSPKGTWPWAERH